MKSSISMALTKALDAIATRGENGEKKIAEHFGFDSINLLESSIDKNPRSYRDSFIEELSRLANS